MSPGEHSAYLWGRRAAQAGRSVDHPPYSAPELRLAWKRGHKERLAEQGAS